MEEAITVPYFMLKVSLLQQFLRREYYFFLPRLGSLKCQGWRSSPYFASKIKQI